jgi:hypothetical protein
VLLVHVKMVLHAQILPVIHFTTVIAFMIIRVQIVRHVRILRFKNLTNNSGFHFEINKS